MKHIAKYKRIAKQCKKMKELKGKKLMPHTLHVLQSNSKVMKVRARDWYSEQNRGRKVEVKKERKRSYLPEPGASLLHTSLTTWFSPKKPFQMLRELVLCFVAETGEEENKEKDDDGDDESGEERKGVYTSGKHPFSLDRQLCFTFFSHFVM